MSSTVRFPFSALLGGKKRVNRKVGPFLLTIFVLMSCIAMHAVTLGVTLAAAAQCHAVPVITAHKSKRFFVAMALALATQSAT
ncbi:hypothetical protein BW686_04920 [Pseudomonas syringae]|uniref:Uncharacterized protein n=1 Tax=Pseudomonas syringae TaxID=317 RepID=A0A244EVU5_PSESX|nr:hypothetical protein BW686_04920 [Pseudomonas syringae]